MEIWVDWLGKSMYFGGDCGAVKLPDLLNEGEREGASCEVEGPKSSLNLRCWGWRRPPDGGAGCNSVVIRRSEWCPVETCFVEH
jgi:hypothetical protein